jgi:hypothetical protein
MVKTEKGDLLHSSGNAVGRGRVSTGLIFSHLQGTDMNYRLKWTKNWGQGLKVCMAKQSQSQVFSVCQLSQSNCSQRYSREDVITVITRGEQSGSHEMTAPAPGCSLIIIGNCPHLEAYSVLQVSTVPDEKFQSLVIKMLSVVSFLESKVIAK